ncbi:MAG: dipeptidyl-peptidase 7, partial [Elusimicrobia bacterium]
ARYARWKSVTSMRRADSMVRNAETIVRWVAEAEKANGKRYEDFRDSNLESLRFEVFSQAPSYPEFEEFLLARRLADYRDDLGADDPFVKAALDGRTPEEAAKAALRGTRLADPAFRKALVAGGRKAVEASKDPLVAFARRLDPFYRRERDWFQDEVEGVLSSVGERTAKARFAAYGKSAYPDATFTLRLSFGKVAGYESGTTRVPFKTTLGGLYARSDSFDGAPPFDLPPLLAAARGRADLSAPRHHGGKLGQPGRRPALEPGGHRLRRQRRVDGQRVPLRRGARARALGAHRRDPGVLEERLRHGRARRRAPRRREVRAGGRRPTPLARQRLGAGWPICFWACSMSFIDWLMVAFMSCV